MQSLKRNDARKALVILLKESIQSLEREIMLPRADYDLSIEIKKAYRQALLDIIERPDQIIGEDVSDLNEVLNEKYKALM